MSSAETNEPYFRYYCHDCNFVTRFREGAQLHSKDLKHFVSSRPPYRDTMTQRRMRRYIPHRAIQNATEEYLGYNPRCSGGKCD